MAAVGSRCAAPAYGIGRDSGASVRRSSSGKSRKLPVPTNTSTSGIVAASSVAYRCDKHPATTSRLPQPRFLISAASRIASIDSFLAASINAQVFTSRTCASSGSSVISKPADVSAPSISSLSARFLGQPNVRGELFPLAESGKLTGLLKLPVAYARGNRDSNHRRRVVLLSYQKRHGEAGAVTTSAPVGVLNAKIESGSSTLS